MTKPNVPCAECGGRTTRQGPDGHPQCKRCAGIYTEHMNWPAVLTQAAAIVESYNTGVTLRQLFYRLVAAQILPNIHTRYQRLAHETAEARRAGTFPDLIDRTRTISRNRTFDGPDEAMDWLRKVYRRDRTEGQEWTIYLGVEKAGLSEQMNVWFTEPLGIPHVAMGGYASQPLCDKVRRDVEWQGRPAVLLYAGDHDPTGEDIDRDFIARTGCWDKVVRVALSREQVHYYNLPLSVEPEVAAKLERDSRAAAFTAHHGDLVQYEVDALDPADLHDLFTRALEPYWDDDAYQEVLEQEQADLEELS